jgi:hypothetical protein
MTEPASNPVVASTSLEISRRPGRQRDLTRLGGMCFTGTHSLRQLHDGHRSHRGNVVGEDHP